MIVFPNAKINLGLSVLRKRTDGYHDIETVMYPVPMHDVLEFLPSEAFTLSVFGLKIPGKTEDNLLVRAWRLLRSHHQIPPVEVKLLKIIPPESGLGGGSSDAVFFLKAMNEFFGLSLDEQTLARYALLLGSDCPFFVKNTPAMARGRGERLKKIIPVLTGKFIIVVYSGISVNTTEAYLNIFPPPPGMSPEKAVGLPITQWRYQLHNSFEFFVFKKHPFLKKIKDTLYDEGAVYASLTGSGSAVYAIFDKPINLEHKFQDFLVWSKILK